MAGSGDYKILDAAEFYKTFVRLNRDNHKLTSRATPRQVEPRKPYHVYNCFAFVVGDRKRFWWPDGISYWPCKGAPDTVAELMRVLENDFNYVQCADGNYEPGMQKVAIFADSNSTPQHIAIQLSSRNGKWKSKMGFNVDMEHDLDAIQCDAYGTPVRFMRLRKRGGRRNVEERE